MEYTNLSNGVKVPLLGLGTFMISPEDTERSVYEGIKAGYRLVDTANAYMNEEAVGKGLRRALEEGLVKREDIFLSTKLWPTLYEKEDAVEKTLKRLGVTYVDLLFIHQRPAISSRATRTSSVPIRRARPARSASRTSTARSSRNCSR